MENENDREQLYNMLQEDSALAFDNECVRKKLNLSKSSTPYKFDNPKFSPDELLDDIKTRSPKLVALLDNIEKLDKMDMKKDGHTYKHFIFSDLKSSSSGAKLIASAMIAKGYHIGYKFDETSKKMELIPEKKLLNDDLDKTQNENIYLLSSSGVYDQPITVANKKQMLATYNKRPDNIHGDLIRFIIMDSGYKEGIDLFDIKYIHIFEPSVTSADQKQVIGRGTRTCGQKGLEFHPTMGWPLHVFVYDYEFPEKLRPSLLNTSTGIELYMKSMNMDFRLLNFTYDIENIIIEGSVDYDLNKNIHSFSISNSDTSSKTGDLSGISGGAIEKTTTSKTDHPVLDVIQNIPAEPMKFKEVKKYIAENFGEYAWDPVKMENLCQQKGGNQKGGTELIHFTPTQSFIRHYFTPENPLKGMLLNHSVGSGKTCSAIAAASSSFEDAGYTILWVTRTTLKSDIWKNMFDQICNEQIRKMVQNGVEIPEDNKKRMRLLSKAWRIRPLSYKQFSNLVSKENAYYDTLVKINGPEDPLRKTLIIIDEAHKLYGGSLSTIEQPDMNALHKAVMNSYIVSGEQSVKLLAMTATPISKSPMELIQLLNLFKLPDQQIPRHFDTFREKYLDEDGHFTKQGHDEFLDVIAGHISYLNREKDARQFSQPQITKINIPIVKDLDEIETFDKRYVRAYLESDILPLKKEIEDNRAAIDDNNALVDKDDFAFLKERCDKGALTVENKKAKRECVKIVNANIREMVKEMNEEKSGITQHMKELRETIKNANLFKREKMAEITDNHENLEEGYVHYKESVYYNLRSKCGKTIRTMKDLDQLLKSNPEFVYYTEEIQKYDNRIQELQTHLKDSIERYKNKIKRIKNMLKMDYNSLEKNVLRMVIKDERKFLRNYTAKETKKVDNEIKTLKVSVKKAEKTRKKYFGNLRKSVKKTINADKRMAKKTRKVEQKLEKQMKREQGIRIDTEDKVAKELVERYGKIIDLEIEEAVAEIEEEEQEKVRKIQEKTDEKLRKAEVIAIEKARKAQERETRKKEKADAIAIEKTRKAHAVAIEKAMRKTKKNKPVYTFGQLNRRVLGD
jgi:hypothetical protein